MKYFLPLLIILLLLLSCSDSTSSSKSFTLSGQVTLLDNEGNIVSAGLNEVLVMIYNTVEIDPDLLKVKSDYPFIGAEITQEVFFDIRDAEPIKSVICNSSGEYTFNIKKGDYNIAYYKENYGYCITHELEASKDLSMEDIVLNEVITLAGSINDFTFENGRVYHITDDLIIPANSNVTFETGANVDVANNKKIFLMDDFHLIEIGNEEYVKFNSIYTQLGNKNIFRGIECVNYPSYNVFKVLIKNATTAISFNSVSAKISVKNSSIINSTTGIAATHADSLYLSNCNIIKNSSIGVDLIVNNTCINNVIFNNYEGIRIMEANSDISNNYILNNHIGIRLAFYNPMTIHYNNFNKNEFGISMSGADPLIEFNDFLDDKTNIEICRRYVQDYYEFSEPLIKDNNILSTNWQVSIIGVNDIFFSILNWGINKNYKCAMNYWGKEKKIKDNIILNYENGYYFIIENEYNNPVINSGIRR